MPALPSEWTVDMVRALPDDGNRYEVIDGELFVTPSPGYPHQRAIRELALLVGPYVRALRLGEVIFSPADIVVFGPKKFVQPDSLPEVLSETLDWQPDGEAPPLVIELPVLFDRAQGLVL